LLGVDSGIHEEVTVAHRLHGLLAFVLMSMLLRAGHAGTESGRYVPPVKRGINKDAMTMQECGDRLDAPPNERPQSDDPRVDLDGMCRNMLSADKALQESQKAKAASAAAGRKSSPAASSQPQAR
jgi:hypothetical protein